MPSNRVAPGGGLHRRHDGDLVHLRAHDRLAVLALLWPMSRRPALAVRRRGADRATETGFYHTRPAARDLATATSRPRPAGRAGGRGREGGGRARLLRASRDPGRTAGAVGEPALRRRRAASAFALSTVPLVALLVYGIYGSPDLPARPQADRLAHAKAAGNDLAAAVAQIRGASRQVRPRTAAAGRCSPRSTCGSGASKDAIKAYENSLRILGDDRGPARRLRRGPGGGR